MYLLVFLFLLESVQRFNETILLHQRTLGDGFVSLSICVYDVCARVYAYLGRCRYAYTRKTAHTRAL